MKRMWRLSWTDGQRTMFADYPKRRQAERQEATIRMLRGGGAGHEIVVWVWVAG